MTTRSFSSFPLESLLAISHVVLLISTTGSGAPPRPMMPFWNMLMRSDLPPDLFEDISFAVFGLGDSVYERFCWPARKVDRRMEALGATRICERGEGDESDNFGVFGAFEAWILRLFKALDIFDVDSVLRRPASPRVSFDSGSCSVHVPPVHEAAMGYYHAIIDANTRITADGWIQDVRHVSLLVPDTVPYTPGVVAILHPSAPSKAVNAFLEHMGWDPSSVFTVTQTQQDLAPLLHFPMTTTLRDIFTHHLDIHAIPSPIFFRWLSFFASDPLEKERLSEFLEDFGEISTYASIPRRTIWETLQEFQSVRIPKEWIFDVFPPIRAREFSLARVSQLPGNGARLELTVAIVTYQTKLRLKRRGLCTSWIAGLKSGM